MLLTFLSDLDPERSKKMQEGCLDALRYKEVRDAANEVLVIPHSLNSAPTPSSGEMVLGAGGQFTDDLLLCPPELESEELAPQLALASSATHDPEQVLQGFGAQFVTAVDPQNDSTMLRNDLENLGSGDK